MAKANALAEKERIDNVQKDWEQKLYEFNKGRFESLWTKDHFDSLKKVFLETGQFFLRSLR